MKRGTTPTHTFKLPFDTGMVKTARVIYSQKGDVLFVKTGADVSMNENAVVVKLTQEETLKFDCKTMVEIQLRILTTSNDALNSNIIPISVDRCLENEVIV